MPDPKSRMEGRRVGRPMNFKLDIRMEHEDPLDKCDDLPAESSGWLIFPILSQNHFSGSIKAIPNMGLDFTFMFSEYGDLETRTPYVFLERCKHCVFGNILTKNSSYER